MRSGDTLKTRLWRTVVRAFADEAGDLPATARTIAAVQIQGLEVLGGNVVIETLTASLRLARQTRLSAWHWLMVLSMEHAARSLGEGYVLPEVQGEEEIEEWTVLS